MHSATLNLTLFYATQPFALGLMETTAKRYLLKQRGANNLAALTADCVSLRHLGLNIVRTATGPRLARRRYDSLYEQLEDAKRSGYIPGILPLLWEKHHAAAKQRLKVEVEAKDDGEGEGPGAFAELMSRTFEDINAQDFQPAFESTQDVPLHDDHTRLTDDELIATAAEDARQWSLGAGARQDALSRRSMVQCAAEVLDLDLTRWANRNKGQEADDLAHRIDYLRTAYIPNDGKLTRLHDNLEWRMHNEYELRQYMLTAMETAWQATVAPCAETDCSPQTSREPADELEAWRLRLELANRGIVARHTQAPEYDFEEPDYNGDYED